MKRMLTSILLLVFVLTFSTTAFAKDFSDNAEAELSGISDDIVTIINEWYGGENISISNTDIDFDQASKIYVDTNVFELSSNNMEEITNALENGNYIYLLPIQVGNGTIVVNIQKGLPLSEEAKEVLTEEEQQQVIDNVGKWIVSSATFYENGSLEYDYATTLSQKVSQIPDETVLVGSLPIFEDVVALIPNEDGTVESIVPVTSTPYEINNTTMTRSSSEVFNYAQIKDYANSLQDDGDPEMAGGYGSIESMNYNSFTGIIVILVLGAIIFSYSQFKKNNKKAR